MVQAGQWPGRRAARSIGQPDVQRRPAAYPCAKVGLVLTVKILTIQRRWRRFPARSRIPEAILMYQCEGKMTQAQANIDMKLEHWRNNWSLIVQQANSPFHDFNCKAPRIIFSDLQEDIKLEAFQKAFTKKFYTESLGIISDNYPGMSVYVGELRLIQQKISSDSNYILQQCDAILRRFKKGDYFAALSNLLRNNILNDTLDEAIVAEIIEISRNMIIELYLQGLDFDEIGKIPTNLLAPLEEAGGHIYSRYPHKTKSDSFTICDKSGMNQFNRTEYHVALRAEFANLTLSARLDRITYYFDGYGRDSIHYIFPVRGLFTEQEIKFGDVIFYNALKKRYATKDPFGGPLSKSMADYELFERKPSRRKTVITAPAVNAMVTVKNITQASNIRTSLLKINQALDLLRLYYANSTAFKVSDERYLACDSEGRCFGPGFHDRDASAIVNPHDISDWTESSASVLREILSNHPHSEMQSLLISAMRWHRKGVESYHPEDKLTCFWISIESIFKKRGAAVGSHNAVDTDIGIITDGLPPFMIRDFIESFIEPVAKIIRSELHEGRIRIDKKILQQYGLTDYILGDWAYSNFCAALPAFQANIHPSGHFVHRLVKESNEFFTVPELARKRINRREEDIKHDLVHIYRHRNRIIHNGYTNEDVCSLLMKKAFNYSGALIRAVLRSHMFYSKNSIADIVTFVRVRRDYLEAELKLGKQVPLLTYDFLDSN